MEDWGVENYINRFFKNTIMVLEQMFKARWLEQRPLYAFFLGLLYAIIGIISSRLIFPNSSSVMSVAFASILLIPSLNILLSDEENREIREQKLSLRILLRDHVDVFEIYFFMFLGVFVIFSSAALFMSEAYTLHAFSNQLAVAGYTGQATFIDGYTLSIFTNNLLVLFVCFLLSLVYGAGSVLFLVWNASVWGVVFGFAFKTPAAFAVEILPIMPHMLGETTAYVSAAIVGGVVSKAVLREKMFSTKFNHIITDAGIFLGFAVVVIFLAAIIETKVNTYKEILTVIVLIVLGIVILAAILIKEKQFILKEETIIKDKILKEEQKLKKLFTKNKDLPANNLQGNNEH